MVGTGQAPVAGATRRRARLHRALLCATMLGGLTMPARALAQSAPALPSGGNVVAGSASIGTSGTTTTIQQTSDRAIINWNDFSVGQGGNVRFENGSGATLNRVTGTQVSRIDGNVSGSGSVYLINANGIVVGKTGVINTGGTFVASTLDVADADFMKGGDLHFAGNSRASIVNLGRVGALGGNVMMYGVTVVNEGTVNAANGTAGFAAGSHVLLRDTANGAGELVSVLYGDATASVTNKGLIAAASAELRAQAGNIYALAGNNGGAINASGVRVGQGKVWLVSEAGTTRVAGTITARDLTGTGGFTETSGRVLDLAGARVQAAGGHWLLDPADLIVDTDAATAISDALNGDTDVTLQTLDTGAAGPGTVNPNGVGDILVNGAIDWSTGARLTLNAWHSIAINADISTSAGKLALVYGQSGPAGSNDGTYTIGRGAKVTLPEGQNFSTRYGRDGGLVSWTVVTRLGAAGSDNGTDLQGIQGYGTGHFVLGADIDASDTANWAGGGFAPITLWGQFDGLGHTISNLSVVHPGDSEVGLFGSLLNASVRNLGIVNGRVEGWNTVGGIAGKVEYSEITNVWFDGVVRGSGDTSGGLVGSLISGRISDSHASGLVDSQSDSTGGLVGQMNAGSIQRSYSTNDVKTTGNNGTGGIVGTLGNGGDQPLLDAVYSTGRIAAPFAVGGIAGINSGVIQRAFSSGTVLGDTMVGGLSGQMLANGRIYTSYSTATIDTLNPVRGDAIGGLVGQADLGAVLDQNYFSGTVLAVNAANVGAVIGRHDGSVVGLNYWNSDRSGINAGVGFGLDEALAQSNNDLVYALPPGFDPQVWDNAGYRTTPYLRVNATYGTLGGVVTAINNAADPIRVILNTDQLQAIEGALGAHYALGADIDARATAAWNNGGGFVSIGSSDVGGFGGTLDGFGYRIDGLTANHSDLSPTGLFSLIGSNGIVRDLQLTNVSITGRDNVAALAVMNMGYVSNVRVVGGLVTGYGLTAGVVANNGGVINSTYSALDVMSNGGGAGGVVGVNTASMTDTHASGNVNGLSFVGGLVSSNAGLIQNSDASGNVTGMGENVGGLVGMSNSGLLSNVWASGTISGDSAVGGLVGTSLGNIENAAAFGWVLGGNGNSGGLVGVNGGMISKAFATGDVEGARRVGGLVGINQLGSITDVYATGAVRGSGIVGGLVGLNSGGIVRAIANGSAAGSDTVGAVIGANTGDALNITGVYWNTSTAGAANAIGTGEVRDGIVGRSTADLARMPLDGFDMQRWSTANGQATPYLLANATLGHGGGSVYLADATGPAPTRYTVILTRDQLQGISNDLTGRYVLGANIDATGSDILDEGRGFTPIGTFAQAFTGVLDGLGFTVSNLIINRSGADGVGMIGVLDGNGVVRNINLTRAGITGSGNVGGIVGNIGTGRVLDSSFSGYINGDVNVGGIAGYLRDGAITGASVIGTIHGQTGIGGVVGDNAAAGTVAASHSNATVLADGNTAGGIVGLNNGVVSTSYATGLTQGWDIVGGLVGDNQGRVTTSYATGSVNGNNAVGGLIGRNIVSVDQSYANATVSGGAGVGGLVGENRGTVNYTYALGNVWAQTDGGGLIGANFASELDQNFAMGRVNGNGALGGLIGRNDAPIWGTNYWNITTAGVGRAIGIGAPNIIGGLTTAQLARALPMGFSASIWGNAGNNTTPYLLSHSGFDTAGTVYLGTDLQPTPRAYGVLLTLEQLQAVRNAVLAAPPSPPPFAPGGGSGGLNYVLGADIDASGAGALNDGAGFLPLTPDGVVYSGYFNGLGHVIRNLAITSNGFAPAALFSNTFDAHISNLGLVDVNIHGVAAAAGIVGFLDPSSTIERSFVTGRIVASGTPADPNLEVNDGIAGGLAAISAGLISESWSSADITGGFSVGGLVGAAQSGQIQDSYATGSVTGIDGVGGLIGSANVSATRVYATGAVRAAANSRSVGGLVGAYGGTIDGFWATDTTGMAAGFGMTNGGSFNAVGVTSAQLHNADTFAGWSIDRVGGNQATWRIYDGQTAPLLKAFLTTASVGATDNRVTYDALSHLEGGYAVRVNGVEVDGSTHVFGTAALTCDGGNCTDAGTYGIAYAGGLYSDQFGYDLVASDTAARLVIDPRVVTVTYTADAVRGAYGDAVPLLTGSVSVDGLAGNDRLSGTAVWASDVRATTGVGSYAITGSGLTASSNYVLQSEQAAGNAQAFTVTPRSITVTADAARAVYGDRIDPFTYRVGGMGLVNGDTFSGGLSAAVGARPDVGSYAIGQGTLELSPNYAITYVGANLTITPRDLTVTYTANALSRIYGDANPALTGGVSVAGLVYGDSVGGTASWSTAAGATSGVGSYAVTGDGITASANYTVRAVQAAGNATALAVTPRAISVTADALSRVYGDANPALTYTLGGMGLVNGDTLTGALATAATATSNVGNYAIGLGSLAASANYVVQFTGSNLAVTPRALTVTYTAGAASRIYGDANPSLGGTVGVVGLVNGDQLTGTAAWTSAATAASNVGNYAVTGAGLGASANYTLTSVQAAGNATALAVTPRGVTVTYTANAATRLFGAPDPVFGGSVAVAGLIGGDTLSGTARWFTSANGNSGPGTYAVNGTGLTASANYRLTEVQAPGNASALTIVVNYIPLPPVVTFDALTRVGGLVPTSASPRLPSTAGCSIGYGCIIRMPAGF